MESSAAELAGILSDLPRHGRLIKDRGYRQIWRFEQGGKPYYLKFYPRRGSKLKRLVRGNPAVREFIRLQRLQKAGVPAPRAENVLVGMRIGGRVGDAVVVEGIEPSVQLDQYLNGFKLRGEAIADHRDLAQQLRSVAVQLAKAGMGHSDLHLGNFLLKRDELFLLDGYAVRLKGMRYNDVMLLGHSVSRFATRTDLWRGWLQLGNGGMMPVKNPVSRRQWRKLVERATGENDYFGRIAIGDWKGFYFKQTRFPRRWSAASHLTVTAEDWQGAWPDIFAAMEEGRLPWLKQSRSGDVAAAEVTLGGTSLPVVVKRPYKRYWYRYFNEIGRGSRARRAWMKAWRLIARNVPTAWPLLVLEKRVMGYVTDSIIVFERVEGATLADVNLDAIEPRQRDMLFRRTGRILRTIESFGYSHFDAKASNWIVVGDDQLGARPVLIDVDGVRRRKWVALGIDRLLRSMREHRQYTPADSLALCEGYAPFSPALIAREGGS
ncbi:MAG TPA: lipopolysaccharide kinase InaA family protein [Tepidisphaeraceae bacterium]|nr:lipopolysaccharide kinase InaA family protein [Tepidisphaeraceae bacterium]